MLWSWFGVGVGFPPPVEHIIGYREPSSSNGVQLVDCHNVVEFDGVSPGAEAERLTECIGGQSAELIAAAGVVRSAEATSPADGDATAEETEGDGIDGSGLLKRGDGHLVEASWKA